MKLLRNSIVALAAVLMVAACSGEYKGVPRAEVLDYQSRPTYGGLYKLAMAYAQNLNQAVRSDTLHPGMYAEYGVTLALMGHKAAANRMLNAEAKAFPESARMVRRIKSRLLPEFVDDTLGVLRDTANILQLQGWAYDSVAALRPLRYVAPVVDSTDTAWVNSQTPVDSVERPVRLTASQKRELVAQKVQQEALRQKAIQDSIEAVKQAQIEAKKQAKLDRERAKKEKEDRSKELKKQREQQAKDKAKQREEERQRRAEERRNKTNKSK